MDCGDRYGVGKVGKRWNVWGCGCNNIIYYIYNIGGCGVLGGGDGSATPSEKMVAVSEFGNYPPRK